MNAEQQKELIRIKSKLRIPKPDGYIYGEIKKEDADWLIIRLEAEAQENEIERNKRQTAERRARQSRERMEAAEARCKELAQENERLRTDIADAARQIPMRGPLAIRVRALREKHAKEIEAAEARCAALEGQVRQMEGALKLIASRGCVFDAKGSWSRRVNKIATAALAATAPEPPAKEGT